MTDDNVAIDVITVVLRKGEATDAQSIASGMEPASAAGNGALNNRKLEKAMRAGRNRKH